MCFQTAKAHCVTCCEQRCPELDEKPKYFAGHFKAATAAAPAAWRRWRRGGVGCKHTGTPDHAGIDVPLSKQTFFE